MVNSASNEQVAKRQNRLILSDVSNVVNDARERKQLTIRRMKQISQEQGAVLSFATIGRVCSGKRIDPKIDTVSDILATVGLHLEIRDSEGKLVAPLQTVKAK